VAGWKSTDAPMAGGDPINKGISIYAFGNAGAGLQKALAHSLNLDAARPVPSQEWQQTFQKKPFIQIEIGNPPES
jgi:hypothetical protein